MTTLYSVIVEDFEAELISLRQIVEIGQAKSVSPKTRISTIHATTLLLAATFEEFVREMAQQFAISVVNNSNSVNEVPDALLETAWKRTLGELARSAPNGRSKREALESAARHARPKIDAICEFIGGDLSQDIFAHLIHNDHNMRATEINGLFKVGGMSDVCLKSCTHPSLKEFFDQTEERKTHGNFIAALDIFFGRRNGIAHSLNSASSSAPEEVFRDIDMFLVFSKALGATLEADID